MGCEDARDRRPHETRECWCGDFHTPPTYTRFSDLLGQLSPERQERIKEKADKLRKEVMKEQYDASEQDKLLEVFMGLLKSATKDGGKKREAGLKQPWWKDSEHEAAIFSHLNKWKHGEKQDKDSKAHPLVHLAWRALAIAYQETYGLVEPE